MKWVMVVLTLLCACTLMRLNGAAQAGNEKPAATVAGKWHFVLNTQGGDRDIDADFQQDGKNVTGKFGKDDAKGTFDDGKLNMEFTVNSEEAGPGTMKIAALLDVASPDKNALKGTWEFQTYSGSFNATRVH